MSHAAAISIQDSGFVPVPRATAPAKLVSPDAAAKRSPLGLSITALPQRLSRRTRVVSIGLLMVATSFGLSMLIVAIGSL
ncbi:hypothetical protein SRS16CHR_02077 [Variovorax sp. SRS16]|uniref:hypothetical protein n=1 Tax=Variovorax sp. SRS16 TaxID=282217 RepID=UPI0013169C31|nr:hypothetical protein [Variovorax sp. SRS16]VTU17669.1 hypothetical protein SRS16CHR_02077 [Variovorax sp. SRS16]